MLLHDSLNSLATCCNIILMPDNEDDSGVPETWYSALNDLSDVQLVCSTKQA